MKVHDYSNLVICNKHIFHKDMNLCTLYDFYLACNLGIVTHIWKDLSDQFRYLYIDFYKINKNNTISLYENSSSVLFSLAKSTPYSMTFVMYNGKLGKKIFKSDYSTTSLIRGIEIDDIGYSKVDYIYKTYCDITKASNITLHIGEEDIKNVRGYIIKLKAD